MGAFCFNTRTLKVSSADPNRTEMTKDNNGTKMALKRMCVCKRSPLSELYPIWVLVWQFIVAS